MQRITLATLTLLALAWLPAAAQSTAPSGSAVIVEVLHQRGLPIGKQLDNPPGLDSQSARLGISRACLSRTSFLDDRLAPAVFHES
jgi:hypothetical protein